MENVQQHFNKKFSNKKLNLINFKGYNLNLKEKELIIEKYPNLKYLIIQDVACLKKLRIKNCENLLSIELHSKNKIEVVLEGKFPNLNNWKVINTHSSSVVYQNEKNFCWGCLGFWLLLLWNIFLTLWLYKSWIKKSNKN